MKFIKQTSGLSQVLTDALSRALEQYSRVVWLVPGGSNIHISVEASRAIKPELKNKLVIMQTDERYVEPNSADCNWHQLMQAGLSVGQAEAYPILQENLDLEQTATRYSEITEQQFERADFIIGQFGIGSNGHTAGIMPGSEASQSDQLVVGYQAFDFARVTLSFSALRQLSAAYAFVYGESKYEALENLKQSSMGLDELPSKILNEVSISMVYNDYIEGEN